MQPVHSQTTIGSYRLLGRLAQGGMGQVFLAERVGGPPGSVVIKILHPDLTAQKEMRSMFLHEARLGAMLDHPSIARIFDYGETDGVLFLAMEFVDGPALSKICRRHGKVLPLGTVLEIVACVADALHHAYTANDASGNQLHIVHRDVTPQNILISLSGEVKLIDFGVAKSNTQDHRTKTGVLKGKLAYMAPEQFKGEAVHQTDIFALGVILHELITGERLFKRKTEAETFAAILSEPIRQLKGPEPRALEILQPIVDRAVARDQNARYPDSAAMAKDLRTAAALLQTRCEISELAALAASAKSKTVTSLSPPTPSGMRVSGLRADPTMEPSVEILSQDSQSFESAEEFHDLASMLEPADSERPIATASQRITQKLTELWNEPLIRWGVLALLLLGASAGIWSVIGAKTRPPRAESLSTQQPAQPQEPPPLRQEIGATTSQNLEKMEIENQNDFPQQQTAPDKPEEASDSVSAPKPKPRRKRVVTAAAPQPPAETESGTGRLFLDSEPWSTVRWGGKVLGQTPLVNIQLPAGKQTLILSASNGQSKRITLRIAADKPTKRFVRIDE